MAEHFGSLALPVGEFLALEHGTGEPSCIAGRTTSGFWEKTHGCIKMHMCRA